MLTARRLYLYIVSGIALGLLAIGAATLLRLVLEQFVASPAIEGGPVASDQLAIGLALVIVGLPLFAIHWWLVDRISRGDSEQADAERRSVVRALFLSIVLATSLLTLGERLIAFADYLIRQVAGELIAFGPRVEDALAVAVVALIVWAFAARTRHGDVVRGPLEGAAAWLSRFYLYGVVVIGALVALGAFGSMITTTGRQLLGTAALDVTTSWQVSLATAGSMALITGVGWYLHRRYARSLVDADDFRGPAERTSLVRQSADVLLFAASLWMVAAALVSAVAEVVRFPLGVQSADALPRIVELTVGPLAAVIPFALAGWWTYDRSIRDGERLIGDAGALAMRRAHLLVLSGTGLLVAGIGLGQMLAMGLEAAFGRAPLTVASGRLADLGTWLAAVVVGLPMWACAWIAVQRARSRDAAAETASQARRGYLFLAIGVSVTAAGIAVAYVVYQVIRDVVGAEALRFGNELAVAIGAAVVGGIVLAYHAWVLRSDLAARATIVAEAAAAGPPAAELAPAVAGVPGAQVLVGQDLVLVGPPDGDFEAADEAIRRHLPAGFTLRVAGAAHSI
jgi:hypothetical protein